MGAIDSESGGSWPSLLSMGIQYSLTIPELFVNCDGVCDVYICTGILSTGGQVFSMMMESLVIFK